MRTSGIYPAPTAAESPADSETALLDQSQSQGGPANVSMLAPLSPEVPLNCGFVLSEEGSREVLIRAIGPGLAGYGISRPASNPTLDLYQGEKLIARASDWGSRTAGYILFDNLFRTCGAFPLVPARGDSCVYAHLDPGAYRVRLSDPSGGTALLEIYFLP